MAAESDPFAAAVCGELEDPEPAVEVEPPEPEVLPVVLGLELELLLDVAALGVEADVWELEDEVIRQGVSATALTGTEATAGAEFAPVEVWVLPESAEEVVAVLLELDPDGTRLEQLEEVFGSEPVLLSVLEVGEEPTVLFDDLMTVEPPLTGPPNASSAVIFRGTPDRTWLAAGAAARAANFGAVETVASTSRAMVWIADGVAAEELVAVLGCRCAIRAALGAGWCAVAPIACWSSTAPPAVAIPATSSVAT